MCTALIGSAVVVGVTGSPLALAHSKAASSPPHVQAFATTTPLSRWVQSSADTEPAGRACGGNYVAAGPTVGGAPSALEAVRRFVEADRPTWPRDGWVEDQELGYMPDIGLEVHHPKFGPFVMVQHAADHTWTVTDTVCEPSQTP